MKPERTQFAAMLQALVWGIFQTFHFEAPEKAENFVNFVLDMAENHGRAAACKVDETYTRVTLLVGSDGESDLAAAQMFVENAVAIHAVWSAPTKGTTAVGEVTPAEVN